MTFAKPHPNSTTTLTAAQHGLACENRKGSRAPNRDQRGLLADGNRVDGCRVPAARAAKPPHPDGHGGLATVGATRGGDGGEVARGSGRAVPAAVHALRLGPRFRGLRRRHRRRRRLRRRASGRIPGRQGRYRGA